MKLNLTAEELETVEIALCELSNSDTWTSGRNESDIDRIAARAEWLLKVIRSYNKIK